MAAVAECCGKEENQAHVSLRPDLTVTTCIVCGHKAYRLVAEKGSLGARLSGPR